MTPIRLLVSGLLAATTIGWHSHAARAQEAFSDREGQIEFNLPSHNIGCIFTPLGGTSWYKPRSGGPELSCDRVKPAYVKMELGPTGPARRINNPGERACCGTSNILAYRKVWRGGPFTCKSGLSGITCLRGDGHGFVLGRTKIMAN